MNILNESFHVLRRHTLIGNLVQVVGMFGVFRGSCGANSMQTICERIVNTTSGITHAVAEPSTALADFSVDTNRCPVK